MLQRMIEKNERDLAQEQKTIMNVEEAIANYEEAIANFVFFFSTRTSPRELSQKATRIAFLIRIAGLETSNEHG